MIKPPCGFPIVSNNNSKYLPKRLLLLFLNVFALPNASNKGFDCRCGGLYCWEHRYSDKHNCKFDYKELGQDQIRKNNPIVIGEKIQKI